MGKRCFTDKSSSSRYWGARFYQGDVIAFDNGYLIGKLLSFDPDGDNAILVEPSGHRRSRNLQFDLSMGKITAHNGELMLLTCPAWKEIDDQLKNNKRRGGVENGD